MSFDGSEGNYYTLRTVAWSPDSKHLVAYHTRPGYDRQVYYIESSPTDQLQPKHTTINYRKPGDIVDIAYPALFDVEKKTEIELDSRAQHPMPTTSLHRCGGKTGAASPLNTISAAHQVYRVLEVDARTGKVRPLIDEQTKTFFYYNTLGEAPLGRTPLPPQRE